MKEAQPVRIIAAQTAIRLDDDRVDCADALRGLAQLVHQRHDGLLVRNGHVDAAKAVRV